MCRTHRIILVLLLTWVGSSFAAKNEGSEAKGIVRCEDLEKIGKSDGAQLGSHPASEDADLFFIYAGMAYHIFSIPEIEARLTFLDAEKTNSALASDLLSRFYPGMIDSVLGKTLGRAVMWHKRWKGSVYLAPLSSQFEHFHESGFVSFRNAQSKKVREWGIDSGQADSRVAFLPNEILYGEAFNLSDVGFESHAPFGRGHSRDYVTVAHWVGWQSETALYYDTRDEALKSKGWAVRIKMWSPKDSPISLSKGDPARAARNQIIRMAVTIKKSLGEAFGMTSRQEYHVDLPIEFDLSLAPKLIEAALARIEPGLLRKGSQLGIIKVVDTNRIGLNVMRSQFPGASAVKVGFLTVDNFSRYEMKKNASAPSREGSSLQLELEVLPEFHGELHDTGEQSLQQQLRNLLGAIAVELKGRPDPSPKYITDYIKE